MKAREKVIRLEDTRACPRRRTRGGDSYRHMHDHKYGKFGPVSSSEQPADSLQLQVRATRLKGGQDDLKARCEGL